MAVFAEACRQKDPHVFTTLSSAQSAVAQGYAAFLTDYMKKPYDMSNEYEVAAYKFGGSINDPTSPFYALYLSGFTQVLGNNYIGH